MSASAVDVVSAPVPMMTMRRSVPAGGLTERVVGLGDSVEERLAAAGGKAVELRG